MKYNVPAIRCLVVYTLQLNVVDYLQAEMHNHSSLCLSDKSLIHHTYEITNRHFFTIRSASDILVKVFVLVMLQSVHKINIYLFLVPFFNYFSYSFF